MGDNLGGAFDDHSDALVIADDGTIYFAGDFSSPDAPGLTGGAHVNREDWFIARADSSGTLETILNGGSYAREYIKGIDLTSFGNIVVTGTWSRDYLGDRLFFASYEPSGVQRFEVIFEDVQGGDDVGKKIHVDSNDEMIITGSYEGILDLCTQVLVSAGESDGFIIRMQTPVAVASESIPVATILKQNHPNPFNPATTIGWHLEASGQVTINIFNTAGRLVRTLVDGIRDAGEHTARWDGKDDSGRELASGVYMYQLAGDNLQESRRMVLLR